MSTKLKKISSIEREINKTGKKKYQCFRLKIIFSSDSNIITNLCGDV